MNIRTLTLVLIAATVLSNCSKKSSTSSSAPAAPAIVASRVLTESESAKAEKFGKKLVTLMNEGKKDLVTACFDEASLKSLVFANMGVSARDSQQFMSGVVKSIMESLLIEGNSFRFLRAGNYHGRPMILVRMMTADGFSNYLEFLIDPDDAPNFKVKDFDSAAAGKMSDQLRMTASLVFKDPNALVGALGGSKKYDLSNSKKLKQFFEVTKSGDLQKVKAEYDALPDDIRKQWIVAVNFLNAHMNTGNEEDYRGALAQLAIQFEGDTDARMTFVDHYFYEKQYDKAQTLIEKLIERYGEDANLLVMLSNVKNLAGDVKGSREDIAKACELEPDLPSAWDIRGSHAVADKDYALAISCFETFEKVAGMVMDLDGLVEIDENFAAFGESEEFQKWTERRAAEASEAEEEVMEEEMTE